MDASYLVYEIHDIPPATSRLRSRVSATLYHIPAFIYLFYPRYFGGLGSFLDNMQSGEVKVILVSGYEEGACNSPPGFIWYLRINIDI